MDLLCLYFPQAKSLSTRVSSPFFSGLGKSSTVAENGILLVHKIMLTS